MTANNFDYDNYSVFGVMCSLALDIEAGATHHPKFDLLSEQACFIPMIDWQARPIEYRSKIATYPLREWAKEGNVRILAFRNIDGTFALVCKCDGLVFKTIDTIDSYRDLETMLGLIAKPHHTTLKALKKAHEEHAHRCSKLEAENRRSDYNVAMNQI